MINTDRIVPVTAIDLISLYGLILQVNGAIGEPLEASTTNGEFVVTGEEDSSDLLANEPVQSLDFAEGVTSAEVYFVAAYDYAGFTINGAAVETTGVTVEPDGRTLYKATLASGAITIAQAGF